MNKIIKQIKLGRLLELVYLCNDTTTLKEKMFSMLLEEIKVVDGTPTLPEALRIIQQDDGDHYCEMCRLDELDLKEARRNAWQHLPQWLEGLSFELKEVENIESLLTEGAKLCNDYEEKSWFHNPSKKISIRSKLKRIKNIRLDLNLVFSFFLYYYVKNNLGKEEDFATDLTEFGKSYGISGY